MAVATEKRLLIIDDEENMRHMLKAMLTKRGYIVETAESAQKALEIIHHTRFEYILCDLRMPVMGGMEFLQYGKNDLKASTVIIMSAYGTVDLALEAMKNGAYDFISKPFKTDEVLLALKKAEEREMLKNENRLLKKELQSISQSEEFGRMIAQSKPMLMLFELAKKVALYDTTVLITGESGTGKELIAKGIHKHSLRKNKDFVAVNCSCIPENHLESEFFGYMKGAFTGADRDRKGLFEAADEATLFLDEIAELPFGLQAKLLRVLQENEIRPLGSSISKKVNVRILAATSKNLQEAVVRGEFREDLYYRINVVSLHIPPLRDRKEDIPLLCLHFLKQFNRILGCSLRGVAPIVMSKLLGYDWPGNVRELENVIQRSMVLSEGQEISEIELPIDGSAGRHNEESHAGAEFATLRQAQRNLEEKMIRKALEKTKGNRSKAANILGVSYPSMLNKIKEYEIIVMDGHS